MSTAEGQTLPMFTNQGTPLLMLMDGHAMVHRSFHAISVQGHLTVSATGEDTTAIVGFANTFLRALQDWKPTYCAIAFDTSAPTFRHIQFEQYKAQRASMPPELRPQFDRVKQLMAGFGVPIFECEGYEADDIIGTLSRQAEEQGIDTIILTGDRDTFQLISAGVRVDLSYSIQNRKVYDEVELAARYSGLTAAQQPDFKALLGDTSDNIPGVPKVGEKRAIGLLTEFGDLEGVSANLEQVKPPSVKLALEENRERAFENRVLMTIDRNTPVELDPEASRFGVYDRTSVVDLLTELEMFNVIQRLPPSVAGGSTTPDAPTAAPPRDPSGDYQAVQSEEQLEAALTLSSVSHTVNTSFLERFNGTDRHRNSRKSRKTYRFSKDWELHNASTYFISYAYNFCWPVHSLRQPRGDGRYRPRSPGMAAGLTDHVWTLKEGLSFPAKIL